MSTLACRFWPQLFPQINRFVFPAILSWMLRLLPHPTITKRLLSLWCPCDSPVGNMLLRACTLWIPVSTSSCIRPVRQVSWSQFSFVAYLGCWQSPTAFHLLAMFFGYPLGHILFMAFAHFSGKFCRSHVDFRADCMFWVFVLESLNIEHAFKIIFSPPRFPFDVAYRF